MAKKRATKTEAPKTTAQQLGSLIKSARDIMRKDRGLNGDLDRLPMLTWVMFLKFLDDVEQNEEVESKLAGKKYRPAIEAPYRWRDWAAKKDGITGDELIKFINNDEAVRPDGKKGPGLFAYLRSLQGRNGDGRRDVIANVFRGVINRMISRLSAAGCGQSGRWHPLRFGRGNPHPQPPLRIHAAGDAGYGRRFRRVLHAPSGRPLHGRSH